MFGQRLSELRTESGRTQEEIAKLIGVAKTTYASYEQGKRTPDTETQNKIADLFSVSLDYLHGRTDKRHYYDLTKKDTEDVAKQAESIIKGLESNVEVNFDGEAITEDQRESLREIFEMGLRINREKAKKKYTPKKYRGSEGGE